MATETNEREIICPGCGRELMLPPMVGGRCNRCIKASIESRGSTLPEQDIEICGCGCGEAAVVNGQAISDRQVFAYEAPDGTWWLAECAYEAEMAVRV